MKNRQTLTLFLFLIMKIVTNFVTADFPQDDDSSISWIQVTSENAPTWYDFQMLVSESLNDPSTPSAFEFTETIKYSTMGSTGMGTISLSTSQPLYLKVSSGVTVTVNVSPSLGLFVVSQPSSYLGIEGDLVFQGDTAGSSSSTGPNVLFNVGEGTISLDGITIQDFDNTIGQTEPTAEFIAPVLLAGFNSAGSFTDVTFSNNDGDGVSCVYIMGSSSVTFNNVNVDHCSVSQSDGAQIYVIGGEDTTVSGNVNYNENTGNNQYCAFSGSCSSLHGSSSGINSKKVVAIVVPIFVVLFCCAIVGYMVHRHQLDLKKKRQQLQNQSVTVVDPSTNTNTNTPYVQLEA